MPPKVSFLEPHSAEETANKSQRGPEAVAEGVAASPLIGGRPRGEAAPNS